MKASISPRAVIGIFGLGLCALGLSACVSDEQSPDRTAMLPADQQVSSIPWNHQQGWENNSQLGALANDPRIGGGSTQH